MIEQLGATLDPSELIPGDPESVDMDCADLRTAARTLDQIARDLAGTDTGSWSGQAADNFAERINAERNRLFEIADALDAAALALADFASSLRWAHRRAAKAIATWAQGEAAARSSPGTGLELPYQAKARDIALDAIEGLRGVGDSVADTLRELSVHEPFRPTLWNEVGYQVSELGVGARNAFAGIGDMLRGVVDPMHRLELQQETSAGLAAGIQNPVAFRYQVMDADTLVESPARWVGGFAPDAAAAGMTLGAGALTRSLRLGGTVAQGARAESLIQPVIGSERGLAPGRGWLGRTGDDLADLTDSPYPTGSPWADAAAREQWVDGLLNSPDAHPQTRQAPWADYQRRVAGDLEVDLRGGGERIRADGVSLDPDAVVAVDAKFTDSVKSPYAGTANPRMQDLILKGFDDEVYRYGRVMDDPDNPVARLRIVTNTPESLAFLTARAERILGEGADVVGVLEP